MIKGCKYVLIGSLGLLVGTAAEARGLEIGPSRIAPLIILTFLLAVAALGCWIGWIRQKHQNKILKFHLKYQSLLADASMGGYYCWKPFGKEEEFSPNLISMFNLRSEITTFRQFAAIFQQEAKVLWDEYNALKEGEQQSINLNLKVKIAGKKKHFRCSGYRIEGDGNIVKGVVLWFYDVSEYLRHFNQVILENEQSKSELKAYAAILNLLPIPLWQREKDLSIRYCNLSYSRMVNEKKTEPSDTGTLELHRKSQFLAKQAIEEEKNQQENLHLIVNGKRKLFRISEIPDRQTGGTIGCALDISRQEAIEQELARHISAHADLLESSSSAMAVFGADTQLKFYNHPYVALWGLDEHFLTNQPTYGEVLEELRKRRKLPEQADFKEFRKSQLALFTTLTQPHNDFFYLPDGTALRVIVIPHALGGLLFAYEDMTDRLHMERSYNTLIAVQKETLDHLDEGVAVFGQDGKLKLHNPKYAEIWPDEMHVLNPEAHVSELLELSKSMFVYEGNWKTFKAGLLADLADRKTKTRRLKLKNGKIISRISVPLPDGGMLVSCLDITDSIMVEKSLREKNKALEEADHIKSDFLANISYELRTPLTSILGFSEVLREEYFGKLNEKQTDYVDVIHQSSIQLMALINDVLDIASFEAGYVALDIEVLDVYAVFKDVLSMVERMVKEKSLKIELHCKEGEVKVEGDEKRIKQMIYNILDNAIKFSHAGGIVTVGAEESGKNEVMVWVKDTGIGIPKEEQDKVFSRFYKTSIARKQKRLGMGIGLAVVKSIINLHQARIVLESKSGQGTKVISYFKKKLKKVPGKRSIKKLNEN